MNYVKKVGIACALLAFAILQFGCGEGANAPSVKLTASAITSQTDTTLHIHSVSIPFNDVSASPANAVYQYRTDATNGHSHVIALTKQQMIDINNGMRVTLTSSSPNAGEDHTHTWNIQGGWLLYDKNCYNCHTDAKRGSNPMNVSFTASQTSALLNPAGAPLSTSPAATPDPNFQP